MKNESYKIGRNSRCLCGSGKKYKRCCMGKDTIKDMVKNKFEKKVSNLTHLYEMYMKTEKGRDLDRFSDEFSEEKIGKFTFSFKEEEFTNGKPIRFIKRFENLPYELKEKMKVIFQHKPMMDGSCYYNSLYLSTLIDGVEKVDGWIDGKGNPKKYKKYEDLGNGIFLCGWKTYKLSITERLSNKIFGGGFDKKDRFIYNENTNRRYYKHSWNKYGDIHFDTTLGIDWDLSIDSLDEEGKNRDEIKPYTDFGAMNLLLKGQPQRNLYLSILDAKNLPFRTESLDIILLLGVFNALRQESLKCQSEYTGSDFVNQVIGECYRVNKQKSHLLICNNVLEPKQDYIQIIQDKGYEIIETLEGKDAEGHTGSLGRYLLVCER